MPECEALLCGSEELYEALGDFKRAVELMAAVAYQLARLAGAVDVAGAIRDAVERYAASDGGVRARYAACASSCTDHDCLVECDKQLKANIENLVKSILGGC